MRTKALAAILAGIVVITGALIWAVNRMEPEITVDEPIITPVAVAQPPPVVPPPPFEPAVDETVSGSSVVAQETPPPDDQRPPPLQVLMVPTPPAPSAIDSGPSSLTVEQAVVRSLFIDPSVTEGLSSAFPSVNNCYQQWKQTTTVLPAEVPIQFTLHSDRPGDASRVIHTAVRAAGAGLTTMESCVLRAVQGMTFTPVVADQPVTVTYRFGPATVGG